MKIFSIILIFLHCRVASQEGSTYSAGIDSFDLFNVRYSDTLVYQWVNAIVMGVRVY